MVYMRAMLGPSPFHLAVDPKYLYLTPLLKTAIHKIQYVVERRAGITAILGDIGLGKSSLLRYVLREYVAREDYKVAIIPTPSFKSDYAFLRGISTEFGLPPRRSLLAQQESLYEFVLGQEREGRNVLLLVDEGQRLDTKSLEVLRVLVNFETNEAKCLQIVLAGQLELKDRLIDPKQKALRSRIFAPTLLSPLSLAETSEMAAFRCELGEQPNPITPDAIEEAYAITGGVPRDLVRAFDMAWVMARISGEDLITAETVRDSWPESTLTDEKADAVAQ
jgi:general secretion pathway protein A